MVIDHICFAVSNLSDGVEYWKKVFGYRQKTRMVVNTLQKVSVIFLCKESSLDIKLIEPLESNESLLRFVSRGGGFHHLCFRCDDMTGTIEDLKEKGLMMLVPPQPGEAFNNNNIAFLFARYGLNLELIDTDERACIIDSSSE